MLKWTGTVSIVALDSLDIFQIMKKLNKGLTVNWSFEHRYGSPYTVSNYFGTQCEIQATFCVTNPPVIERILISSKFSFSICYMHLVISELR